MDLAIGIDVGFSASTRSTGVVILDRDTKTLAAGCVPLVATTADALDYVLEHVAQLQPASAVFAVDGSFAAALPGTKARLVERFFSRGGFASVPAGGGLKLRLMPSGTATGSRFLASTRMIVDSLVGGGHLHMSITGTGVTGTVVEIFPTLFMAALLPPHAYLGKRGDHSDDLWLQLIGTQSQGGNAGVHPALMPYQQLIDLLEAAPRRDLHDLRAAAISAIAADWFAAAPPGSGKPAAMMFIGHGQEFGFLLASRARCSPEFMVMLDQHWAQHGGSPLIWI